MTRYPKNHGNKYSIRKVIDRWRIFIGLGGDKCMFFNSKK
jgi:hypothetical protein